MPHRALNETHDPSLISWVTTANDPLGDFPLQNLPFAIFRRAGTAQAWRGGVAIGDQIVDLLALHERAPFIGLAAKALEACTDSTLNRFMSMGTDAWSALRLALSRGLRAPQPQMLAATGTSGPYATSSIANASTQTGTTSTLAGVDATSFALRASLIPQNAAEFTLPATIGDYTDFYASIHHATRVGKLFRPDNPLLPNYKWVPIGYHGRASSIVISGHSFPRPLGQVMPAGASSDGNAQPQLAPTRRLDYELEIGAFIGTGNELGAPVSIDDAEAHVFGLCLLNDWSARDVQAWEYQPLGPFLAKNFATTISPWIVTLEALAPFRTGWQRSNNDPQPLPYLNAKAQHATGAIDIRLSVFIETAQMRERGLPAQQISHSNFRDAYWTLAQLVAHHTVNGCNLVPGDLLGSGTQSGEKEAEAGCLLELTAGGKRPLTLNSGEQRTFLEDGDSVILKAHCKGSGEAEGARRIGFGSAVGTVLPARV